MAIVIVGLGNPGKEYEATRHNAGRAVAALLVKEEGFDDLVLNKAAKALVAKGAVEGENVTIVLPETMMNLSGKAVTAFVKSPKAAKQLLVIHDDLDLPLGTIKMVFGRGSGGHKGVESIMRAIKTKDFARLRIGISPKKSGPAFAGASAGKDEKVIKHVIGKWKPSEAVLVKKVFKKSAEAARLFATAGLDAATQFANTR